MTFRFAAVISHPIQHYAPIFRELGKVPGLQVKAFFFDSQGLEPTYDPEFGRAFAWDVPLLEGYEYEFLGQASGSAQTSFFNAAGPRIVERLNAYRPHAIWVHGYGHRSCRRTLRWAGERAATLLFGDSELLRPRSLWRRLAKQLVLRRLFRRCDAFITIGDNNEAYYAQYGVPYTKMFRGACPIDVRRFQDAVTADDRPSRAQMRAKFGLPEQGVVVVFSGKLIPLKRPGDLVQAIAELQRRGVDAYALFVGDGPLRAELQAQVEAAGLARRIRFAGFVNQREMPLVLECGDVLAVTSDRDAHPLAVTESMAVGHPVIVSDRVGCVGPSDSARPGVNSLVYPVGQVAALADALQSLVGDAELRARMSRASLELVKHQDVPVTAAAVLGALRSLKPRYARQWADIPDTWWEALDGRTRDAVG
ncbi:MAG: glycosyltransferase family 4 protein [Pirellulaceae bacterium]|nr:glycosyltransferase family 4 protein [Pirellulaceae bacterium]